MQESLKEAINTADVVIAVLGARNNLAPGIEAGIAVALGKKLVVVADKGVPVPTTLSSALLVRGKPGDIDAIRYALDEIDRRPALERPRISMSAAKRETLGADSDILVLQLNQAQTKDEEALRILTTAIEASGALAVQNPKADSGFDLGVWSDELSSINANPLLIEFTKSFDAFKRKTILARLRENPVAQTALVVYMQDAGGVRDSKRPYTRSDFPILAISAQDFLAQLKVSTFSEVVRRLRNRSVHGV
ncbi:hypothetical protein [Pseudarthrobacter niigatensis]|uniref:hypothetical protein n=1 Tax=Pseudarthrobacter niigatensis TaxID=369935 RepID=UPI00277ECCB8|nr:hypothetical protein [Pseudarthrobacter niigatensis]MDQ0268079.1 hypothetical protein [Pseudarthrobacter niigatensis]